MSLDYVCSLEDRALQDLPAKVALRHCQECPAPWDLKSRAISVQVTWPIPRHVSSSMRKGCTMATKSPSALPPQPPCVLPAPPNKCRTMHSSWLACPAGPFRNVRHAMSNQNEAQETPQRNLHLVKVRSEKNEVACSPPSNRCPQLLSLYSRHSACADQVKVRVQREGKL